MLEVLRNWLANSRFIPHDRCYLWKPELLGLHVFSDASIAIAYGCIPFVLLYLLFKQRNLPFKSIVLLFSAFLLAGSTTHLMAIWTLWWPENWFPGTIEAIAALISLLTMVKILSLVSKVPTLTSPVHLEATNQKLKQEMTERQQAELALRESQECFRNAFDYAAIGMALVGLEGRWLKVNASLCELVGYSEQELYALTFQDITHPDDLETDLNYAQKLLSNEISYYQLEKRYLHKLGHEVWILLNTSLVRDIEGRPSYFIAQIQDITERKRAETALKESEERYLAILEYQTELITRFQPDGTLTFINEAYCRYYGKTREELIGHSYEPLVFEEDRQKIVNFLESLTVKNPVGTIENRGIVKGQVRWMQWINQKIFDEEGHLIEFQSVGRDITDSKLAELEIIRSRDLKEAIFNESTDAIFLVDSETLITLDCNHRAVELFEASSKDEIINISGHWLQRYQFSETELIEIGKEIKLKGFWVREIEYVTKKGNFFWGNLAAKKIQVADRSMNLVRVTDISERKQTEDLIRASLREKEVMLKEIHHRVKNNLQIISSLLNLQSSFIEERQTLTVLQESQNRVRAMALIHEKLYQSKDLARVNFAEYIQNLTLNLFRSYQVKANNVTLETEIRNISLSIDLAIPCGLIINELVSNALKYAFPNDRRGEVFLKLSEEENQITLVVADNGIGLPKDFKMQTVKSLGWELVRNLTKQIKGSIALQTSGGTQIQITFSNNS